MRRWGLVISIFYAVAVAVLFVPGFFALTSESPIGASIFWKSLYLFRHWFTWTCIAILTGGQALLLFLSVDASWRRLGPRQHVAVTALFTGFSIALLATAAGLSVLAGSYGDSNWPLWPLAGSREEDMLENLLLESLAVFIAFWTLWGGFFYIHYRGSSHVVTVAVSWLLRGSVLELLIAVPAHVVARQRGDCSAPLETGFGIVTGIAIMLLCFGPGVLALYKKKFDFYRKSAARRSETP